MVKWFIFISLTACEEMQLCYVWFLFKHNLSFILHMIFNDRQTKCALERFSSFIIYLIWLTKTLMYKKTHTSSTCNSQYVWVQMKRDIMLFRSVCHMILKYSHVTSSLSRTVSGVQLEGRDFWSELPLKRFTPRCGSAPSRSSSSSCNSRLSPASIGSSVTSAGRSNKSVFMIIWWYFQAF